jgi:hypothetical protein
MATYKQLVSDATSMDLARFLTTYQSPFLLGWRMLGGSLTKKAPVTASYMLPGQRDAHQSADSSATGGLQKESTLVYKGKAGANIADNPLEDNTVESCKLERPYVFVIRQPQGKPGPVTIGRTVDADVTINDYSISSTHAQIIYAGGTGFAQITDMGSTNGTAVGTKRLGSGASEIIQNAYWVTLGRVVCQFFTRKGLYQYLNALDPDAE